MLYPTCNQPRQSQPNCIQSLENLGILRFFASVVLAVTISFTIAACCSRGSQTYEKLKLRLRAARREYKAARESAAINLQARFRGNKARVAAVKGEVGDDSPTLNLLQAAAGGGHKESLAERVKRQQAAEEAAAGGGGAGVGVQASPRTPLPKPKQVNRI